MPISPVIHSSCNSLQTRSSDMTMAQSNNTRVHVCIPVNTDSFSVFLLLAAFPFHVLLIKILAKDFYFTLPRHIIMFSLSLSDGIQIVFLFLGATLVTTFSLTTHTSICLILRGAMLFIGNLTVVVSSLAVITMSLERYVACIHSFRLHQIFTNSRVIYGSIAVWIIGTLIGLIEVFTEKTNTIEVISKDSIFRIIFIAFVIPASVIVICIQFRLFFFSRKKLNQVKPNAFGVQLELAHFRKKQIKVAFVASTVALAFVFCMLPTGSVFIYESITGLIVPTPYRKICISLGMANTLADPFIYGFGIADTRRMIFRDLKRMKKFVFVLLPIRFKNDVSP